MTLFEKQKAFSRLVARFINDLTAEGYEITFGETWRPPETAKLYSVQGKGIANSLHLIRLAIDLNLFKDGKYLTDTEQYAVAGRIWESYSTDTCECSWGGHFGDGDHFSITHGGIK